MSWTAFESSYWKPSPLCQLCCGRLGQTKISAADHFLTRHKVGLSVSSIMARDLFVGQTTNQQVWQILVEMEAKQEMIDRKQLTIKRKDGFIKANEDAIKKLEKQLKRKSGEDKETMTDSVLNDNNFVTEYVEYKTETEVEVDAMKEAKKKLASKIEMKSHVKKLFKTVEEKSKLLQTSEKKNQDFEKEIKTLKEALKHKRNFIETTMNNFCTPAISNENTAMKKEVKELTKKNLKLNKLVNEKDLQIDALQKKLKRIQLEEEMGGLLSVVRKQSKKIDKQAGLLKVALEDTKQLESKLQRQNNLVQYFKNELVTERYETEVKLTENKNLEKCIHGLKFRIKDLDILLDEKVSTIRNLEIHVQKTAVSETEKESFEASLNDLERQLQPMQKEFETLKMEKGVLVKLLESSNQEIKDNKLMLEQMRTEKERLVSINRKVKEEVRLLHNKHKHDKKIAMENSNEKKLNLDKQLLNELDQKENFKNLEDKIVQLEEDLVVQNSLKENIYHLQEVIKNHEEVLEQLKSEKETLFAHNLELNEVIKDLNKKLAQQIEIAVENLNGENPYLENLNEENLYLINQLEELRNDLSAEKVVNDRLARENTEVQNDILEKRNMMIVLEDKIIKLDKDKALQEDCKTLLDQLKPQLVELEAKWKEQEDKNLHLRKTLESKNRKLEGEQTDYKYKVEEMNRKLQELENKNSCLMVKFGESELSTESLKEKISKLYEATVISEISDPELELEAEISRIQDEVLQDLGDVVNDLQNNNTGPSRSLDSITRKENIVWKLKQKLELMQKDGSDQTLVRDKEDTVDETTKIGPVLIDSPDVERDRTLRPVKRKEESNICSKLGKKSKKT